MNLTKKQTEEVLRAPLKSQPSYKYMIINKLNVFFDFNFVF